MIAKLRGLLDSVAEASLVIDVNGVGYLVFASSRTLGNLPATGDPLELMIDTHVREDFIHLYGFLSAAERDTFRLAMTVQGVGAKVALAILGVMTAPEFETAVAAGDKTAVSRANGVGPKLAQRIVNELKDKVTAFGPAAGLATAGAAVPSAFADAVSALVNLGYRQGQAHAAVARVIAADGDGTPLAALIRKGLKELSG